MPCGLFKPVRLLTPAILTTTPWFLFVSHFADEKLETQGWGQWPLATQLRGRGGGGQRQGLSLVAWFQGSLFLLLGCVFSHSPCDPTTLTPTY